MTAWPVIELAFERNGVARPYWWESGEDPSSARLDRWN